MAVCSLRLGLWSVALFLLSCTLVEGQITIRLGFLLPYPQNDSTIPIRLADEWISAVRVALDVLGPRYQSSFTVEPFVQNSNCNRESAREAAQRLVYTRVVGVVGPACSEAAIGAAEVLGQAGIPFISFAATADALRARDQYPTFYRTVYGDRFQADAIKSVIEFLQWKKVYIFYSQDTYGHDLAYSIMAQNPLKQIEPIAVPVPPKPVDYEALFTDNNVLVPDSSVGVILATNPKTTKDLFLTAQRMKYLQYPWWFLGTDSATTFDLVGQGEDLSSLVSALQGELGVRPFKGNYDAQGSPYLPFIQYWQSQPYETYPGLLTLPVEPRLQTPRAYVPYLIDAVWTFYHALNNIITIQGFSAEPHIVLKCLEGIPTDCVSFDGCTGPVAFDAHGERRQDLAAPAYNVVNLIGVGWVEKTTWTTKNNASFTIPMQYVERPGPIPLSALSTSSPSSQSGGPKASGTSGSSPSSPSSTSSTSSGSSGTSGASAAAGATSYVAPAGYETATPVSSSFVEFATGGAPQPAPPPPVAPTVKPSPSPPPPTRTTSSSSGSNSQPAGQGASGNAPPASEPQVASGTKAESVTTQPTVLSAVNTTTIKKDDSSGSVITIIALVIVAAVLAVTAVWFYQKYRVESPERQQFVRML